MGKITRRSDREETPRRKRRKKDLDKIHSKILKAKKKLDKLGKNGNKGEQKKRGPTKICARLLPRPAAGIYRNGAKGRNIQKEISERTLTKARLEADALKLFNGDTPASKCTIKDTIHDKSDHSLDKEYTVNALEWTPCTMEQSPVLGKKRNHNKKLCLVKKKSEGTFLGNLDPTKIRKQNINKETRYAVQREDICKRRLFQNDKEQLKVVTATQSQVCDDVDHPKENRVKQKKEQICSEDNKSLSWAPLNRYMELCALIRDENFETGFLQNYHSDPVTTTIKKLRHAYADSFRQHFLREKTKQESLNSKSFASSVEYQACTYSDSSPLSPVEFEIPKCTEKGAIVTRLRGDTSQKCEKFFSNSTQNIESKESIMHYNSTFHPSWNTRIMYGMNNSLTEDSENDSKQYKKQLTNNIHQSQNPANFCFVNEKKSAYVKSEKNPNCVSHTARNDFQINASSFVDTQYSDKMNHLGPPIFSNNTILPAEKHLSRDYPHEHLPTKLGNVYESSLISDTCAPARNDPHGKFIEGTMNKCNAKNVKRIPTILRRCNNVLTTKNNRVEQINGEYNENLGRKTMNLFNGSPNNNVTNKSYEREFPNFFEDFPASNIVHIPIDRPNILEPKIGSMKIKDSQELEFEKCDIKPCSSESNVNNEFCRFHSYPYLHTFETSHNTTCNDKLAQKQQKQQKQLAPNVRKHIFHPDNNPSVYYLQDSSNSNLNVKSAEQVFQQTKSRNICRHTCETNDMKQEFFVKNKHDHNKNILFTSAKDNDISMATLNFLQATQIDKQTALSTCKGIFDKTVVKCAKDQSNPNTCHCNERYTHFDGISCPRKSNIVQAPRLNDETSQMIKCHNNNTDNCINTQNGVQNVQLLSLEQNRNQHRAVGTLVLQNITQPVKYLAVKNGSNVQRIPVYMNDRSVGLTENVPLKVMALMESNNGKDAFPQEITAQVIPLQASGIQLDNFTSLEKNNRPFVKHLDSVNAVLFNTDLQSNNWYASNL